MADKLPDEPADVLPFRKRSDEDPIDLENPNFLQRAQYATEARAKYGYDSFYVIIHAPEPVIDEIERLAKDDVTRGKEELDGEFSIIAILELEGYSDGVYSFSSSEEEGLIEIQDEQIIGLRHEQDVRQDMSDHPSGR